MYRWSVIAALAVCGGSKSTKELVDEHRAAAQPVVSALASLASIAKQHPPVNRDGFQLPSTVTLDFVFNSPGHNAAVLYGPTLVDPCAGKQEWDKDPQRPDRKVEMSAPLDGAEFFRAATCALATGTGEHGVDLIGDMLPEAFKVLTSIKYVLVVRPSVARKPSMDGMTEAELETYKQTGKLPPPSNTFRGGRLAGDAMLYELATAKRLGGLRFDYQSADKVKVQGSDQIEQLGYDLLKDARFDLAKRLTELAPTTNIRP
jgi:hypothetical protein